MTEGQISKKVKWIWPLSYFLLRAWFLPMLYHIQMTKWVLSVGQNKALFIVALSGTTVCFRVRKCFHQIFHVIFDQGQIFKKVTRIWPLSYFLLRAWFWPMLYHIQMTKWGLSVGQNKALFIVALSGIAVCFSVRKCFHQIFHVIFDRRSNF